jgi:uncharacterized membrane protein
MLTTWPQTLLTFLFFIHDHAVKMASGTRSSVRKQDQDYVATIDEACAAAASKLVSSTIKQAEAYVVTTVTTTQTDINTTFTVTKSTSKTASPEQKSLKSAEKSQSSKSTVITAKPKINRRKKHALSVAGKLMSVFSSIRD